MRWIAGAVVATTALVGCSTARSGDPSSPAPDPPATEVQVVLRPGQTRVTGTLTALSATGAVGPPVRAPFTVTVPTRGGGGATITGALVGGRRSTIVWDGGRPLPVSGDGALDIGPAPVDVSPTGIRWRLDGQPRLFTSGRYRLGATVAVGGRGLATPTEGATFGSDGRAAMVTRGGATLELPPAALRLEGPGTVSLRGRLRVETRDGAEQAGSARLGEGAFVVSVTPDSGAYRVEGLFQGPRSG